MDRVWTAWLQSSVDGFGGGGSTWLKISWKLGTRSKLPASITGVRVTFPKQSDERRHTKP